MKPLLPKLSVLPLQGLDIPKHAEPAYPMDAYGDGWNPPQSISNAAGYPNRFLFPDVFLRGLLQVLSV